jgi:hypothetical protein
VTGSTPSDYQPSTTAIASEPAAPAPQQRRPALTLVLLGAVWLVLGTLLQLARQRGVPASDTIWAEDGSVFLAGALSDPLGTVPDLYSGYLHIVPRLMAMIAAAIPLAKASLILSGGAAFIVALLSLYVLIASSGVFRSVWAPPVLAAMIVVLPAAGIEAANNVTNLRWFLLFAAFWSLLHRVRSRAGVAVASTVAAGAALSDPLAMLLLPLAATAWKSRDPRRRAIVVVFAIAALVQGVFIVGGILSGAGLPPRVGTTDVGGLIGLFGLRVAGSFWVGERLLDDGWQLLGWWFAVGSLIAVALLGAYGVVRTRGTRRWLIASTLLYAAVLYAVPVATRGTSALVPDGQDVHPLIGTRYAVAPILLLVSMTLLTLDARRAWVSRVAWRSVRYVFLLVTVALLFVNFSVYTLRSSGPTWSAELTSADRSCAVSALEEVEVAITPTVPPGIWELHLQCDEVRQGR